MDRLFYLFHGDKPFGGIYGGQFFSFPVLWFLLLGLCCYLNLSYPFRDLNSFGQQMLLRSKKRVLWLCSKLVWCVLAVTVELLMMLAAVVLYSLATGSPMELTLSGDWPDTMFPMLMGRLTTDLSGGQYLILCVLMPYVVLLTLTLLQFVVGLMVRPVIGFFAALSVLAVSAIWMFPLAFGNYAMAMRSGWFLYGGVPTMAGLGICVGLSVLLCACAVFYFGRYDIFTKEDVLWN